MNTSKIIKAYIGAGTYSTTEPITQGDYGYILQIEGAELPATYRVDFSNNRHEGEALPVYGNENGAEVPKELIDTGKDVYAFYYYIEENFGKTAYTWKIPNDTRAKNGNRVPTPTQQDSIDQLIVRSNEAVESAEQSAEEASISAQSASDSAIEASRSESRAQTHALNAERSSTNADLSANDASESAEAAARSANQAAQIKADVEGLAGDAEAAANSSGISARASGEFASQAQGFARQAESYANGASGYASQASESAQTASTKASEASQSATTASDKATESAQSASQALTYKTDAESAKTASQTAQGLAESARDLAQGYAEDAQASAESISASASQIAQNTADIASLEEDRYKPYVTDSASGSIASFPDGADGIPLKSLVVDINPVQDTSSGDPSPENICPISGWEGANITHFGKNCISNGAERKSITTSLYAEYTPVVSLENATSVTFSVSANVPSGQTLKLYGWTGVHNTNIGTLNLMPDGRYALTDTNNIKHAKEFRIYSQPYTGGSSVITTVWDCTCIINEIRTDYIPYNGRSIPISWQSEAGTVYGGKLDVLSGVMRITHTYTNLPTSGWAKSGSNFWHSMTAMSNTRPVQIGWCTHYKNEVTATGDNTIIFGYSSFSGTPRIVVRDSRFTTASDFMAFLAEQETNGTPVMIAYPLATPIEIQLTPQEVNSLLGANNIFADTGDTEVEYRADTKLYIEKLTQPEEDDMIADSAISEGQFFMIGNSLYRALANIASGATITVGTNAQRVSLADALNLINT